MCVITFIMSICCVWVCLCTLFIILVIIAVMRLLINNNNIIIIITIDKNYANDDADDRNWWFNTNDVGDNQSISVIIQWGLS